LWKRPPPLPSPQPLFLPPSGLGPASAPEATGPATIESAMSIVTTRTAILRPMVIAILSVLSSAPACQEGSLTRYVAPAAEVGVVVSALSLGCAAMVAVVHRVLGASPKWTIFVCKVAISGGELRRKGPSETVWKISESFSRALLWRQQAADRNSLVLAWPLSGLRFGTHPEFPNSFSTHSGE
jgi:hypothetical protein